MTKQRAIDILNQYLEYALYAEDYIASRDEESYRPSVLSAIEEKIEALQMAIRALNAK